MRFPLKKNLTKIPTRVGLDEGQAALPAPAPPAKRKKGERTKKSLRYHRGATTPFRRRGHPAATAASRNCAASRGAARPPDVAALSGFRRFCDRRHGLDRSRPARDAAPRRVRVRADDVTTRERDDEEATREDEKKKSPADEPSRRSKAEPPSRAAEPSAEPSRAAPLITCAAPPTATAHRTTW